MTSRVIPPQSRLIPKHDISKSPPPCPKCYEEMRLLRETPTHWEFGCERDQFAHVFTKPQAMAAAQHRVLEGRREQAQKLRQAYDSRIKYFPLGGSKNA